MAALCYLPSCHRPVSKLLSNSKSQGPLHPNLSVSNSNPNPNISGVGLQTRRRSSSFSIKASTTAFAPLEHSESTSLGEIIRSDFPILRQKVNGRDLVYLDNAATSQKPNYVLTALKDYYESSNSNVHRGVHYLSQKATTAYENAREKIADFINASDHTEIVFTRNATEAINLVANSWGDLNLGFGDEILLTVAEHHSAIVPWQIVAKKKGASLKYIGLTAGEVPDIEQLKKALSKKTKLVVTHHVSNTLGSVLPIEDIVIWSHEVGARVLLDACQSVPHMRWMCKSSMLIFVASSHKNVTIISQMCGPTGIGFLYGKSNLCLPCHRF
ncbi:hypothetical protein KFK09_012637 [Dendrobium nobile]|uniref:Aminotransferase class V domain-containing protein n=1 Tax=Dendrobium nobile TaxID=94219 RepID=A0A8T3BHY3_DENNO|nr:hypothetical protein KFK09_012637 [Dendrobium nobile]